MMRCCALFLLLGALVTCTLAQPDPNAPPVENRPQGQQQQFWQMLYAYVVSQPPLLVRAPQGVFVVRGGVLAKYASDGQVQGMVELFGPMPQGNDQAVFSERLKRLLTGAMLVRDADLYLVIGDRFFRVDAGTLEVKADAALLPPAPAADITRLMELAAAPALVWGEGVLLVTRGTRLLKVSPETGKVLGEAVLPDQFATTFPAGNTRKAAIPSDNPRPLTAVGMVLHHLDRDGDFWTLRADGGEYVLTGEGLERLLKTPALAGRRIRVTGTLTTRVGGFGQGILAVGTFEEVK
jgi:hypothetical protein